MLHQRRASARTAIGLAAVPDVRPALIEALPFRILRRFHVCMARGQLGSALVYVNNWWQISQHVSYFARFGPASPLNHLWSLSVEEQFYILCPAVLLLLGKRRALWGALGFMLLAPLIRVNTVCPGYIDTPWFTKGRGEAGAKAVRDSVISRVPLKSASTADDIAQLVCFLALPQSGQMTGEFVRMDAGMHLIQ